MLIRLVFNERLPAAYIWKTDIWFICDRLPATSFNCHQSGLENGLRARSDRSGRVPVALDTLLLLRRLLIDVNNAQIEWAYLCWLRQLAQQHTPRKAMATYAWHVFDPFSGSEKRLKITFGHDDDDDGQTWVAAYKWWLLTLSMCVVCVCVCLRHTKSTKPIWTRRWFDYALRLCQVQFK